MPFGKLHEFDLHGRGNWAAYVRLVDQFILLNDIKQELRVATLVTHVGAATYELMCDLCAPDHPEKKDFKELVDLVRNHLDPKRSEIAERHIFRQRRQAAGETIGIFLQNLKHLATYCNFGSKLEENIRDQFVSGLRSEEMRSRLFAEPTLDYKKAVELALALEAAERHAETAAAGSGGGGGAPAAGLGQGAAALHHVGARAPTHDKRRPACWRCGRDGHAPNKCRYKSYTCNQCRDKGHLSSVCKKSGKTESAGRSKYQNYMEGDDSDSDASDGMYNILSAKSNIKDGPYYCELKVENRNVLFEIDTGSRISAVSKEFYEQHFSHLDLQKDNIKLQSYTGEAIVPLGRISVRVTSGSESADLPLFVISNGGPPLLGRFWLRKLNLESIKLNKIADNDPMVLQLKNEFPEVFDEKLGTFKTKIKLHLKDSSPIFCKARPLPLALRMPVERELERLQSENVIYKVESSEYGTPIVPIVKRDGSIRICGDYKVTVNKYLKEFHYPLPRIEQLFAALSGGEQFTKLDLKNAYLQLVLDVGSQPLTAITTHVGTFVYRRAPFGIKCLPEIFQKLIEETLSGLEGVVAFIDDICVTGRNKEHHMQNLYAVLRRLRDAGLRIKFEKCEFFKDEVCYLGYRINKLGLHTDKGKIAAINNLPVPQNVPQLRAVLGLINYYSRFIPNISTMLQPLYALLAKGTRWEWTPSCAESFTKVKEELLNSPALAHYEPSLPLVLCVDSSAYGLGAILAQRYPDGTERLVCCASRVLSETERRYSQIDKEALAIVYGVNKHHQYLFGRKFTLRSDHKALTYIFGPKHGLPQTAASRLQRYAVRLAAYDFDIEFVSTEKNGNADCLSRLPLPGVSARNDEDDAAYLHFVEETFPLSHRDVARETKKDITLCKIYGYIMSGWPSGTEIENEKPYFSRKDTLHIDHECIVWGYRVVVPGSLRAQIVEEVHAGHVGMVRMKQIARAYVWWPGLDADLEQRARSCAACSAQLDAPPRATPAPYAWPAEPWLRLHADFLHHNGRTYFLVIDAHSKWIEIFAMTSGTSAALVSTRLRECFARFGLPVQLVTDGGPPFTSHEFETFLQKNGVLHVVTAPYHPSSNGAAENAVKTVKKVLKKASAEEEDLEIALLKFLLQYRNSPHCTTRREPAVAMLGRRLRTRLDLLRAGRAAPAAAVQVAQSAQQRSAGGAQRELHHGDHVLVRNYSKHGPKWTEGTVTERTGAVTYKVKVDGQDASRHVDQLIKKKIVRYSLPSDNLISNPELATNEPEGSAYRAESPEFRDAETSLEGDESAPGSPDTLARPSPTAGPSTEVREPSASPPARDPSESPMQKKALRPRVKRNYKM